MKKYSQPDFYHFSSDSIELAARSSRFCRDNNIKPFYVLDIGAGCGVVGAEFSKMIDRDIYLIGVEQEQDFENFFYTNTEHVNKSEFINMNLFSDEIEFKKPFDIILSNPPYFKRGAGRMSQNKKKNNCRFFNQNETLKSFIDRSALFLKDDGHLFILSREEYPISSDRINLSKRFKLSGAFLDIYQKKL